MMPLMCGLRSGWALRLGLIAGLVLLVAAVVGPSASAAAPPDLGGVWVNSADTASDYTIVVSSDHRSMKVSWRGIRTHSGLVGEFKGTLASTGDRYTGTFTVTEAGTTVIGTGTFAISSQRKGGYPLLNVKLTSSSGAVTLFRLEIWLALPHAVNSATPGVAVPVDCAGSSACTGEATADAFGGTLQTVRLVAGEPGMPEAYAARTARVGVTKFTIKAGHAATIVVKLNRAGRTLLKKLGSLRVKVTVTLTKSGGLPHKANAGTVTLHKR